MHSLSDVYKRQIKGIPDNRALYMTNAKLTAAYLDAVLKEHADEREYVYPDNLLREYIPEDVFNFFNRLYDHSLSDAEVFKSKLNFKIGDCEVTIAYGGIHGAIQMCIRDRPCSATAFILRLSAVKSALDR